MRPIIINSIGDQRAIEYTKNDPQPSIEEHKNICREFQNEMKVLFDKELQS